MMTNHCTELIFMLAILLGLSSRSFAAIPKPENVAAKCKSDGGIEVTQDNHASYPSLFYTTDSGSTWEKIPKETNKYSIPAGTGSKVKIVFSIESASMVSTDTSYDIDCVKTTITVAALPPGAEVITSSLTMTLAPAEFNFAGPSTLTLTLAAGYAKAIFTICEIGEGSAPTVWIPIHDCKTAEKHNIIETTKYDTVTNTLTATMTQIRINEATTMTLRCAYEACVSGSCTDFEAKYGNGALATCK